MKGGRPDAPPGGLSACGRLVRAHDHDRYLACLFAPADRREAMFAVHAFNVEIARTREVVSQPLLGQIRLQWWRDAIDGLYAGQVARHEVVVPLAEAVRRFGLSRGQFERVLDAREADLADEPPATLAALEAYAEATAAPLVRLCLEILGEGAPEGGPASAAGPVGTAWALTGLLRAVPFHARQRRVYLPADLLRDAGLGPGSLFAARPPPGLSSVCGVVAGRARTLLAAGRAHHPAVPRRAMPALLPATLAGLYLAVLDRAGHDPFDPRVQQPHPWRLPALALNAALGRY